jgi:hypothetical protein
MTSEAVKNPAASIRARLLALAQSKGQDYQRIRGRYAIGRFSYRLGRSTYRNKFVLKEATLFKLSTGETHPHAGQERLPDPGQVYQNLAVNSLIDLAPHSEFPKQDHHLFRR